MVCPARTRALRQLEVGWLRGEPAPTLGKPHRVRCMCSVALCIPEVVVRKMTGRTVRANDFPPTADSIRQTSPSLVTDDSAAVESVLAMLSTMHDIFVQRKRRQPSNLPTTDQRLCT